MERGKVGMGRLGEHRGRGRGTASGPDGDRAWVDRIRGAMLDWFDREGRDLPWRRDRDPYKVLVSEVMLIQTTVAAAGPYFERFLHRFPTADALARADEADVIKAWEGLGYYRRARQLHAAARVLVADHGGTVPEDPDALRALPGVGRYIAGAVLSIAFDRPEPILEANTQRVLARWLAWPDDIRSAGSQSRLWEAAGRLVPPEEAGRFNQALMDLGATLCTPRAPRCLACPVSKDCQAHRSGLQDELPRRSASAPPVEVIEACALILRDDDRLLVVRRGPGRLWDGFWEFPTVHLSGADPAGRGASGAGGEARAGGDGLPDRLVRLTGVSARLGPPLRTVRYGVTKHKVTLTAFGGAPMGGEPAPGDGVIEVAWESIEELSARSRTVATRRLASWAADHLEEIRDSTAV